MCKTPFGRNRPRPFLRSGPGSLAASWTRPRDRRGTSAEAVVLAALGALVAAAVFAGGRIAGVGARDRRARRARAAVVGVAAARRGVVRYSAARPRVAVAVVAAAGLTAGRGCRPSGRSPATARGNGSAAASSTSRSSRSACSPERSCRRRPPRRGGARRRARRGARLGAARRRDPSLFEDGDRIARLREPVGYWNALALLADGALALGLWLARDRPRRRSVSRARPSATPRCSRCSSPSRGPASSPAVLVLALWLVLSDRAARGRSPRGAPRRPGARSSRVGVHASGARRGRGAAGRPRRRRARVRGPRGDRALPSRSPASGSCPSAASSRSGGERSRRALAVVACGGALAGAAGRRRRGRQPDRLGVVPGPRRRVRERPRAAHRPLREQPARVVGRGARDRRRPAGRRDGRRDVRDRAPAVRDDATPGSEPHSVPLQLLADLGVVGSARAALRRPPPSSASVAGSGSSTATSARRRPLACLVLAYGVHSLVDYDLDFLAVTGPALAALGALLAAGRPRVRAAPGVPGQLAVVAVGARRRSCSSSRRGRPQVEHSLDRQRRRADRRGGRRCRARAAPQPALARALDALAVAADAAGDETRPSRGTRRRRASSPRTRTPGMPSASTTRSRPTTSAPRTRRSTGRTRSTRTARGGWRAACSTSRATPSTPGRASGRRYEPRMNTACAPWSCAGRMPSSGPTSLTPRSRASRRPSPSNPRRYMTIERG